MSPLLPPLPAAGLQLACARPVGRPPRPPLGATTWTGARDAGRVVLLDLPADWPSTGFGGVDTVARQLPDRESLAEGTLVIVLPRGAPPAAWLGRLLARRTWVPGALRATALLARGYRDIGAAMDPRARVDLVWGYA